MPPKETIVAGCDTMNPTFFRPIRARNIPIPAATAYRNEAGIAWTISSRTRKRERMMKINNIKDIFFIKNVRYGGFSILATIGLLGIIFLLNIIFGELNLQIDVTKNKIHSLTSDTTNYVKNLEDEVNIYAFFRTGQELKDITDILDKYDNLSDNRIYVRVSGRNL